MKIMENMSKSQVNWPASFSKNFDLRFANYFIYRRNIGQLFHPNGNYNWNLLLGHFCESFGLVECWKFESMVDNPMVDFLFSDHFLLYLCFTSNRHLVRLDSTWTHLGTFKSSYSFCCFDFDLFLDSSAKIFCLGLWRKIIVS